MFLLCFLLQSFSPLLSLFCLTPLRTKQLHQEKMNSGSENEPYHTNTDGHHSPTVEGAQPTVVPAQHSSATFTGATSPSMSGDTISSGARVHFADESPNTNDGAPTVSSTQRPKVTVPSSATNNPAHKKDNPLNTREMTSPVQSWQASFDSDASAMGRVVTPEDQYSAVYPSKTRSVLITKNKGTYKAVADSLDEPQVTNVSFLVPGLASSEGKVETPQLSNGSFLLPENEQRDIDHNDALHAYEFIVDDADNVESSSSDEEEPPQTQSKDSHHEPFASRENSSQITNTSRVLATEEAAEIMEQLSRSFALQRHAPKQASAGHFPFGTSDKNSFAAEGEYSPGDDYYFDLPMPEVRACTSVCNLECESVSWVSIIQSGKSDALLKALFFGFRITLFCIFPSYVLVEHPNTKAYFVSGTLLPIMGALSVREPCSLGMQCLMTICGLQGILVFMIWGCVTNAVGTKYNTSAWWCALISGAFAANLLGDLLAKRLIMMFIVIVMQMQHMPGGETIGFPIRLARDILFPSSLLWWPSFCRTPPCARIWPGMP
ncbi:hypothetical protein AGDE_13423 [Angomonas deanei]|nr:hypothetical protein AGDE_13423 [Angomonas deanei]|eukprot:EPY22359.1 hypothetical protein AGDE_13423 [Angomonas deanei]